MALVKGRYDDEDLTDIQPTSRLNVPEVWHSCRHIIDTFRDDCVQSRKLDPYLRAAVMRLKKSRGKASWASSSRSQERRKGNRRNMIRGSRTIRITEQSWSGF